jgi:hypothetical protein
LPPPTSKIGPSSSLSSGSTVESPSTDVGAVADADPLPVSSSDADADADADAEPLDSTDAKPSPPASSALQARARTDAATATDRRGVIAGLHPELPDATTVARRAPTFM